MNNPYCMSRMSPTTSNTENPSIPDEHFLQRTLSAFVSHYAHIPNLALDHARTIQQILEDILVRHRCYGGYTIQAEFDETMARTGQGLLQVIVINLDAVWCSRKMEHEIGLAVWPFVAKLHMKPLPLPRRTLKIVPIAPGSPNPPTGSITGPSPTLIPFLGRNDDVHAPHAYLQTDDDNEFNASPEIKHIIDANPSSKNSEHWQLPIHSSIQGDYAMSLDSQIDVEVVPETGKHFVHFNANAKMKRNTTEFPSITVSITPLQLSIPRVIDEKTTRLVPLSKLPTLITSNLRARVARVLNLNLPQDHHSSLQAVSYIVKDTDSTQGTISSVEKALRPVNVGLKQGHVDIHGRSCNAELDWCYNLAKPFQMHSITLRDPARATFILCGPRPDDWPLLDFDFVTVWRLQNEKSTVAKYLPAWPCARTKEPTNAYSHVAHRVSAQIDLNELIHNCPGVSGQPTSSTNEAIPESPHLQYSDVSNSATTSLEGERSSGLHFMFMHALRGRVQKKKSTGEHFTDQSLSGRSSRV